MKVVILAGGRGTRLAEITETIPKPMAEIGPQPILWHIMKLFAHYGLKEFIIALGYRGEAIKRYFLDYYRTGGDLTIDLSNGHAEVSHDNPDDWKVHLIDTAVDTLTGGRVKRVGPILGGETFMVTYGDGVSDVPIDKLIAFHSRRRKAGCLATVTAVHPSARFGSIVFDGDKVAAFAEKPQVSEGWINGGFIVCEPEVLDYIPGDDASFEVAVLEKLAHEGRLGAYRHHGFWQCMDTLREKQLLNSMWQSGAPPWKVWP